MKDLSDCKHKKIPPNLTRIRFDCDLLLQGDSQTLGNTLFLPWHNSNFFIKRMYTLQIFSLCMWLYDGIFAMHFGNSYEADSARKYIFVIFDRTHSSCIKNIKLGLESPLIITCWCMQDSCSLFVHLYKITFHDIHRMRE